MSVTLPEVSRAPLTIPTEDEIAFRDAVREFAEGAVAPRVADMDRDGRMDPQLITQLFEMGLMGVEIPEQHGGAGSSFFTSILVIEEL